LTTKRNYGIDTYLPLWDKGMSANAIARHVQAAMAASNTQITPSGMWVKTKAGDDGVGYSVYIRPGEESAEQVAEKIAARMCDIPAAPAVQRPKYTRADMLNFLPVYDVHMGMRVGDYGTAEAVERLKNGAKDVIDRAPPAETIIILTGGDYTEANDNEALTPASKHPLSVDMDFEQLSDIAVDTKIDIINYALRNADRVVYQALRANHDPAMAVALRQALRQRYRGDPRFELKEGFNVFTHEWEGNFIAAIHGHQKVSRPQDLSLAIAARHAQAWGAATHRELWRGHNHKELTVGVPGMTLFQVNPICPAGRYANDNLFTGQSDIQCVTYGKGGGRKAATVHIFS